MEPHLMPHETFADLERKLSNQRVAVGALNGKLAETERDLASLKTVVSEKNAKVTKLEAENIRLKMQRTDVELAGLVESLKKEVGTKDRRLVEVERAVTTMKDSEALALRRASEAEQKVKVLQATLETMQTARDTSERCVEAATVAARDAEALSAASVDRAAQAAKDALAATKPYERLVELAYKIVQRSPSLNRNESEVKAFQKAREALVKAPGTAVVPG